QFEYNALCAIGNDLDLALSASMGDEAIRHIENAKAKTLDRMVVLNVAREYAYGEMIEQARQAANLKQRRKRKYVNKKWFFQENDFYKKSEEEMDFIVPKEKEMIHSCVTTAKAWGTMQIIAPQGQIDNHLKENQVNLVKQQSTTCKGKTIVDYSRAPKLSVVR
ncbi:334_t:CDS:2, partial [Racocetra fulgida]